MKLSNMSNKQNDIVRETRHEAEQEEDYGRDLDEREGERYEDRAEESNYQGYDR